MAYEAVNRKRKEVYVGLSMHPMHEVIRLFRTRLPAPIRHWEGEQIQAFRSIEFGLVERRAREFVDAHIAANPRRGWRYIK